MAALAGRLGGIAAIDTRTGEIRALAGLAFSAPQPPGSTFKIITTTAALEARAVKASTSFPVESAAIVDGVELENANGEFCGGSFRESFAHSCNSVFAPLGVKVGAERIVDAALRYGWNAPPGGARRGTQHPPSGRGDPHPPGGGLHRHRAGQGAGHAAAARLGGPGGGVPRRAPRADPRGRPVLRRGPRDHEEGGADTGPAHARRGGLRHRHRGRDTRHPRGGKDRDGRAGGHARAGRRCEGRRTTARTPTHGSPPTRRCGARGSRWPCCWCAPGRVARPRPPRPGWCWGGCSAAERSSAQMSSS